MKEDIKNNIEMHCPFTIYIYNFNFKSSNEITCTQVICYLKNCMVENDEHFSDKIHHKALVFPCNVHSGHQKPL